MEEHGLSDALTSDGDFEQAGFVALAAIEAALAVLDPAARSPFVRTKGQMHPSKPHSAPVDDRDERPKVIKLRPFFLSTVRFVFAT